jgi:ABC-2 type transport system permease protein
MIGVELVKLLRRPRTWVSLTLTCALPLVVAIFIVVTHLVPPPGQGSAFLSAVLANGALYPAAALALVLPVFLPVATAVVAGDSIAGEATTGTLRYLLVRPVSRTRLLVAKLISVIVYVLLVVLAVTVTAYATGVLLVGPSQAEAVGQTPGGVAAPGVPVGPGIAGQAPTAGQAAGGAVTSLSGSPLTLLQLVERTAGAIAFITVSMLGVAAIALFLSTITNSALGAALGALAALVTSEILVTLNAAAVVQPYLPTRYWLAWIDFFRQPVFWRDIQRGFGIQAVYVVVFLAAAWANFSTKDITALPPAEGLQGTAVGGAEGGQAVAVQGAEHDADDQGGGRELAVGDGDAGADGLQGDVHRAGQPGRVGRLDHLVVGGPQ